MEELPWTGKVTKQGILRPTTTTKASTRRLGYVVVSWRIGGDNAGTRGKFPIGLNCEKDEKRDPDDAFEAPFTATRWERPGFRSRAQAENAKSHGPYVLR